MLSAAHELHRSRDRLLHREHARHLSPLRGNHQEIHAVRGMSSEIGSLSANAVGLPSSTDDVETVLMVANVCA